MQDLLRGGEPNEINHILLLGWFTQREFIALLCVVDYDIPCQILLMRLFCTWRVEGGQLHKHLNPTPRTFKLGVLCLGLYSGQVRPWTLYHQTPHRLVLRAIGFSSQGLGFRQGSQSKLPVYSCLFGGQLGMKSQNLAPQNSKPETLNLKTLKP